MALQATIHKFRIALSDLDRDYYDQLDLTVARHPSETQERMLARVLALCLHAAEQPVFTRGLSTSDEPDLKAMTLDDRIALWIDVGEPAPDRIKKACRQAQRVCVYAFNTKSDTWWAQNRDKFRTLPATVIQLDPDGIKSLAEVVERTMDMAVTLSGQQALIATREYQGEIHWTVLQDNAREPE